MIIKDEYKDKTKSGRIMKSRNKLSYFLYR